MKNIDFDISPFIESCNILKLKVLLLPGLPQVISGILFTIQKNKINIFSFKILFLAIPFGISKLFSIKSSSIIGIFEKLPSEKYCFKSSLLLNIVSNSALDSLLGNLK